MSTHRSWTRQSFLIEASRALGSSAIALTVGQAIGVTEMALAQSVARWRKITIWNEGPPARQNSSIIYDSAQERLIIFGGRGEGGIFDDTWAFSLRDERWTSLTVGSAPPPRFTPTAIYDPQKNRMVIYSGQGPAGFFNDTWALDLNSNQWTELKNVSARPEERYGTILVYDSKRHGAVTFAGFTSEAGRFDDTWNFSLTSDSWEDLEPKGLRPGRRCLHMGAYDSNRDRLVIYRGQRLGPLGDIWAFDLETRSWRELTPAVSPSPRMFGSMVYDANEKRMIVFGGMGAEFYGDLWAFDSQGERWAELVVSGDERPAKRHSHSTVWVSSRGMLVFGGSSDAGSMNDLWELSLG